MSRMCNADSSLHHMQDLETVAPHLLQLYSPPCHYGHLHKEDKVHKGVTLFAQLGLEHHIACFRSST